MLASPARSDTVLREPVSRMQLVFDEEDEEGKCTEGGEDHRASADARMGSREAGRQQPAGSPAPQHPGWDAGATLVLL